MASDINPECRLLLKLVSERRNSTQWATLSWLHAELLNRNLNPADFVATLINACDSGLLDVPERASRDIRDLVHQTDTQFEITPAGRRELLASEGTLPQSTRIPADVLRDMQELCSAEGFSRAEMTIQLLRESTRTRHFPEIEFRGKARDRKEYLARTRLSPWFVRLALEQHDGSVAKLREHYPDLTPTQIRQADSYARRYAHEAPSQPPPPAWIERVELPV